MGDRDVAGTLIGTAGCLASFAAHLRCGHDLVCRRSGRRFPSWTRDYFPVDSAATQFDGATADEQGQLHLPESLRWLVHSLFLDLLSYSCEGLVQN